MLALCYDVSFFHDHDNIRGQDRRQSMCDDDEVRPCMRLSNAFWTTRSASVSNALVASSSMSRAGFS